MANRRVPTTRTRAVDWQRDIDDRLAQLERGGQLRGRVSLSDNIVVGGVAVTVQPHDDDALSLTFTNPATGSSFTIHLP